MLEPTINQMDIGVSTLKRCWMCGDNKPATLEYFYKCSAESDGLQDMCKMCNAKRAKKVYSEATPEQKEKRRQSRRIANMPAEKRMQRNFSRRVANMPTDQCEKNRAAQRIKNQENPVLRLVKNWRKRIWDACKTNSVSKDAHSEVLLGCSWDQFLGHLEINFQEGMTWENYGPVWHVDHVRPLASFDLTDPAQQREAFHWKNHQPLWAQENLCKGAKWQ